MNLNIILFSLVDIGTHTFQNKLPKVYVPNLISQRDLPLFPIGAPLSTCPALGEPSQTCPLVGLGFTV